MMSTKQKLTLSVDARVVSAAKRQKLNISHFVETELSKRTGVSVHCSECGRLKE